jgi:hypothetical protein
MPLQPLQVRVVEVSLAQGCSRTATRRGSQRSRPSRLRRDLRAHKSLPLSQRCCPETSIRALLLLHEAVQHRLKSLTLIRLEFTATRNVLPRAGQEVSGRVDRIEGGREPKWVGTKVRFRAAVPSLAPSHLVMRAAARLESRVRPRRSSPLSRLSSTRSQPTQSASHRVAFVSSAV